MERRRRRYWTWAVTGTTVAVIAAATASGLFQLVVQAVPGYRTDVENYVKEVTGRPVRIGTLELTWRYTYPSLDLGRIALLDASGEKVLLEAERLRLGFSLKRLLQRNFTPNRLELQGLEVDVTVDPDGRLSAPGWEPDPDSDAANPLAPLANFDQIRLERCRLNLHDERRQPPGRARGTTWSFGLAYLEVTRGLLRNTFESELALPGELGEAAMVSASLQGDWLDLATWTGDWSVAVTGVNAGTWLAPYLEAGTEVSAEALMLHASGELQQGNLRALKLGLESGPVRARRAPHEAGFESLNAALSAELSAQGWTAELTRFELNTAAGRSPDTRVKVRARGADPSWTYEGEAERIRVADFAPWLRLLPVPEALLGIDRLSGEVGKVSFNAEDDGVDLHYRGRAEFSDLSLPAGDRPFGAAGLTGELAIDETGGRVILKRAPATLQLPHLLEVAEVPVEALEGEAQWRRDRGDWIVQAPRFRWKLLGTEGEGKLQLTVPADNARSPQLSLEANMSSRDLTLAKPLMPRHWSRGLRNWLDRAIVAGSAPEAHLKIDGALADFPFIQKKGVWELDVRVQDAQLAFHPDWPAVDGIDALVKFRGNGLAVECTDARIAGNTVQQATAKIADFKRADLVIDGSTQGESARYFDYLSNSPLRGPLSGLLTNRVQGPAGVEVHLQVPLSGTQPVRYRGRATAAGTELKYPGLKEPFRDIRGQISFDESAVKSDSVQATWYGLPLRVTIAPQDGTIGVLTTALKFKLDEGGRGPSELIPEWLRKVVAGDIGWAATLRLGGKSDGSPLKMASDLTGVEVRLPAPLGKSATEAIPLDMTVGSAPNAPLRITLDYRERFGADLRFTTQRELHLTSAALRVGGGPPIEARAPGMILGGAAGDVDVRTWYETLDRLGFFDEKSEGGIGLDRADVHIGRAYWNEFSVLDMRYQWQRNAKGSGWSVATVGAGAAGELRWNGQHPGRVSGRLESLNVQLAELGDDVRPPSDPSRLPLLDFDVGKLRLNQADLGHLQLLTERVEHGQTLKVLNLSGGSTTLTGSGEWRRQPMAVGGEGARQSTGRLDFDLSTNDIAGLLKALRYAPNLDAKSGTIKAQLQWERAQAGLDWRQARGPVHVAFENGQLRAVEPGAGRVLGLMNFYALPRRLTLNFRDVVSSGLGFDKIEGDFALGGGDAVTDNLQIRGPSLRMDTRGRIGLAARDYDQQVTVYPDVSAGVTLGALALGGPVAGVLALIAQEVLGKPLNQVTQLSYRLTGSWDNPRVERVEEPEEPSKPRTGSPSKKS